jgi:DNA invertase Pin-like site-specific DNA recombinase
LIEEREKLCSYKTIMLIGYARVSTPSQSLDLQIDALAQTGCDQKKIFTDIASGSKTARPGLDKALDYAREGDIIFRSA